MEFYTKNILTDKKQLMEEFPQVSPTLIEFALDSTNQNKEQATLFLQAMTPQDSDKYFPKPKLPEPPKVIYPSIYTQTGALVPTEPGVAIVLPLKEPDIYDQEDDEQFLQHLFDKEIEKPTDKSTWTKEDGIIQVAVKQPLAKGPDPSLRTGPTEARTQ